MRYATQFPLFQSHLDLAHSYWHQLIQPGDIVVDATCGNGQDSLILCNLTLQDLKGKVWALDIQAKAIEQTQNYLAQHLKKEQIARVFYQQGCHSQFPTSIETGTVTLIIYNLGYLPGNNKDLTTLTHSTLESLKQALALLKPGGLISITCYPGHAEGLNEQIALLDFVAYLPANEWSCCHHQWLNRKKSPSLLLLQKTLTHHT